MLGWILVAGAFGAGAALTLQRVSGLRARVRKREQRERMGQAERAEQLLALQRDCDLARAEYDSLRERCGAGVLVLEESGVVRRANTLARQLLNTPIQSLEGSTLLQATLSDELDGLFRAARDGRCLVRREIRTGTVSAYSLVVSVSPLPLDADGAASYLLVAQNVTELRRLETIRRDFVANVSHELRTPLASIRAMAETLQDGAMHDADVAQKFLGTIVTETQRLTRIAEDLLVLSDAESHLPEKRLIPLSEMLAEIVARFHAQAEKHGVVLTAELPQDLDALANPDQMEQVIVNLVDNAIKYTGTGGRVHVSGERRADGVAVHVSDTGIGILRQDVPRIFERFYRVDKARSRQSGGTGLGLSIVKHIVEAHGGRVAVESEFNRGSTFSFFIPATDESGDAAPVPAFGSPPGLAVRSLSQAAVVSVAPGPGFATGAASEATDRTVVHAAS